MSDKGSRIGFIMVFGCVWTIFGVFGLIEAPERSLVTLSQFLAGALHFIYAFLLWRKTKS